VGRHAEHYLVALVIVVSMGLTGLTVWAVAEQGRALQARELTDLRNAAATAAAQRQARLATDTERAFEASSKVWEAGGQDELDAWAAGQTDWLLACCRTPDGVWTVYPRTPLEAPLPSAGQPTSGEQPASARSDLLSMLNELNQLATSPDPLTRAAALLGMATCERQLGHPLAAARICADAAHLLRSNPRLARLAFRAELARIDSLLAAGDSARAADALTTFLSGLLSDHPARLATPEVSRLQQQTDALGLPEASPVITMLAQLRVRAEERQEAAETIQRLLAELPTAPPPRGQHAEFLSGSAPGGQPLVVALRQIGPDVWLALGCPAADLLQRYWDSPADAPWQVRLPEAEPAGATHPTPAPALLKLGPEFGGAIVEPSLRAGERLRAVARRQLAVVLATGGGASGAWMVVIWLMLRLVARQRELARLQARFVADISHELKTPLALIRLLSETLADRRVRDPQRVHAYHETICRESERLTLLLDNILDLGRIQSGRKQYQFTECDVGQVARQAWALFEPQFAAEGFDARLEISPDLPTILADGQALQQVMVNLLQNAYRYSDENKYVRLSVTREGYLVLITVEDHGIGMNRQQLKRLGDSFFRAEDARVRQQAGVGLGLAIVHHIVSAHQGKIEVESRPGQGSKFTVWIPFQPAT